MKAGVTRRSTAPGRRDLRLSLVTFSGAALLAAAELAWAHHFMDDALPKTFVEGLLSGLGHPLIGADHAAFIIASGFLLALVDRGLAGIVALIGGTLTGAAMHLAGMEVPGGEVGIALSVILIGALLVTRC